MKFVYCASTLFVLITFCDASESEHRSLLEVTTENHEEENPDVSQLNNQVCTPNDVKVQDCNRCKCAANGIGWFCTRNACPPVVEKIPINAPGYTCTPNEQFMDHCNSCTCDASGAVARCTIMACDQSEKHKRETVDFLADLDALNEPVRPQNENSCKPGTTWMDDCNRCWCSDSGFAACTLIGCFKTGSNTDKFYLERSNRVSRQVQQNAPDSPSSSNDQKVETILHPTTKRPAQNIAIPIVPTTVKPVNAPTTKIYNPQGTADRIVTEAELKDPQFKCTPSLSFKVECNTCWCAADGKGSRFCTRIACKPQSLPPLSKQ